MTRESWSSRYNNTLFRDPVRRLSHRKEGNVDPVEIGAVLDGAGSRGKPVHITCYFRRGGGGREKKMSTLYQAVKFCGGSTTSKLRLRREKTFPAIPFPWYLGVRGVVRQTTHDPASENC